MIFYSHNIYTKKKKKKKKTLLLYTTAIITRSTVKQFPPGQ